MDYIVSYFLCIKVQKIEEVMLILKVSTLLFLLLFATLEDIKTYKVSNNLIALGLLLSLVTNIFEYGVDGLVYWFLGGITPIVLFFLLYLCRMLGAGDLKVYSIVGSFLGVSFLLRSIIFSFTVGAIIAFFILLKEKSLLSRFYHLFYYLYQSITQKRISSYYNKEEGEKYVIPFTVAIFVGVILCLVQDIYQIQIAI